MKTNIKHVFAKLDKTPLFTEMSTNGKPIIFLEKGIWIGVVAQIGDWYKVITTAGNGYVQIQSTCLENGFKLRVLNCNNGKLSYAV